MDMHTIQCTIVAVLALIFVLVSFAIRLHHQRTVKNMWDKRSIEQFRANTDRRVLDIHNKQAEAALLKEQRLANQHKVT